MLDINTSSTRSYATKEALLVSLKKKNLLETRYVIVRNDEGRYTAIFAFSGLPPGLAFDIASQGFMVLG